MLNVICYLTVTFYNSSHGENLLRGEILEKGKTYYYIDFTKEAKRLNITEIEEKKDLAHIRMSNTKCEETREH